MPPLPSRMTKNRVKDFRYRPGKAEAEDDQDDEYDSDEEADAEEEEDAAPTAPAPKVSSFPSKKKIAIDLSRAGQQRTTEAPAAKPDEDLEGFVTASESEGEDDDEEKDKDKGLDSADDDDDDSASSSEEEDSSSDDEPAKPMLAPKFLSKSQRLKQASAQPTKSASDLAAEAESLRLAKADEALRSQLALDAAARAQGKKAWDDDDNIAEEVDDTDDLDPEAERAAWKLRELKRVRRDRLAIEGKEAEREEIERRRGLSKEEREAEDAEFIAEQRGEREGKGKMAFMQKYYHKGAFFAGDEEGQDDEVKAALNRDLAGARFEDESAAGKEALPEYMKIRDTSLLGRKGRTKYKDLKSEDTGRWGVGQGRKRDFDGIDDRFRPDGPGDGGRERTGANDVAVGVRKPRPAEGKRDEKRTRYE